LLLRQPLSIKKSYAGAIHTKKICPAHFFNILFGPTTMHPMSNLQTYSLTTSNSPILYSYRTRSLSPTVWIGERGGFLGRTRVDPNKIVYIPCVVDPVSVE
jgi:hypothetical protein